PKGPFGTKGRRRRRSIPPAGTSAHRTGCEWGFRPGSSWPRRDQSYRFGEALATLDREWGRPRRAPRLPPSRLGESSWARAHTVHGSDPPTAPAVNALFHAERTVAYTSLPVSRSPADDGVPPRGHLGPG